MKKIYMLLAAVLLMVMTGCGGGGDTAQAPPSTLKAITVFYLNGFVGTIDETASPKAIAVTMPYGTDVTSLVAMFMTTGASVQVDTTVQKSETTVNNFTTPLVYTVTAADGSSVTYTVTVTVAAAKPRAFTAFSLNGVAGTINETEKKISVRMPSGTVVTALVATFNTADDAPVTVGSTDQISGVTPNDFTSPVVYMVTAADSSTQTYTVKINDYVETKREYDDDKNGTPDTVYYYSYYTDGRKAKDEIDSDNNGTIDDVVIYGYDANYNNTKVEYDLNNNGTIEAVYSYTYDADDKVTKTEFDLYNDGTIDSVNYYTYVNGKKTKDEYDGGEDGTIDSVYYYTYDASGNLTKEEYDDDNKPATTNYIVNYAYDASGNLIEKTGYLNNDSIMDSVSYIYDSGGNLIKENYDYSDDGTIEYFITYTYENGNMKTKVYDYWSYTYYWALI